MSTAPNLLLRRGKRMLKSKRCILFLPAVSPSSFLGCSQGMDLWHCCEMRNRLSQICMLSSVKAIIFPLLHFLNCEGYSISNPHHVSSMQHPIQGGSGKTASKIFFCLEFGSYIGGNFPGRGNGLLLAEISSYVCQNLECLKTEVF